MLNKNVKGKPEAMSIKEEQTGKMRSMFSVEELDDRFEMAAWVEDHSDCPPGANDCDDTPFSPY